MEAAPEARQCEEANRQRCHRCRQRTLANLEELEDRSGEWPGLLIAALLPSMCSHIALLFIHFSTRSQFIIKITVGYVFWMSGPRVMRTPLDK
ncbi:hypothetical protein M758_11G077900 [Ceratodon purpureus]|nr:hypothetical protein M758_11G077900 [Ceratodon purpureus]KAG0601020.1 hypothetical protein M758_11G077900 [Ceratodon purpureus]KAG0601021.1 hypothetical protein M758_11G077900 [Ceratodon purpureus]